jgi:hypothetical protein
MVDLEFLENRALLSIVSATQVVNVLTITGDSHGDSFSINECGNNEVSVVGTDVKTSINGSSVGVASEFSNVTTIDVYLLGNRTTDNVSLTETPNVNSGIKTVLITTTVNNIVSTPVLNLSVTGVTNAGPLIVMDGTSTSAGGQLSCDRDRQPVLLTVDLPDRLLPRLCRVVRR